MDYRIETAQNVVDGAATGRGERYNVASAVRRIAFTGDKCGQLQPCQRLRNGLGGQVEEARQIAGAEWRWAIAAQLGENAETRHTQTEPGELLAQGLVQLFSGGQHFQQRRAPRLVAGADCAGDLQECVAGMLKMKG